MPVSAMTMPTMSAGLAAPTALWFGVHRHCSHFIQHIFSKC